MLDNLVGGGRKKSCLKKNFINEIGKRGNLEAKKKERRFTIGIKYNS